jgi:hypothetical protein
MAKNGKNIIGKQIITGNEMRQHAPKDPFPSLGYIRQN